LNQTPPSTALSIRSLLRIHESSSVGARPSSAAPVDQKPFDRIHEGSSVGARPSSAAPVDQKPFDRIRESSSVGARPSSAAPVDQKPCDRIHESSSVGARPRPPPSNRSASVSQPASLRLKDCELGHSMVVSQSIRMGASLGQGRPRTEALRQKSFRVSGHRASDQRGRPRTDALRLKSFRVSGHGASDRRGGRGRTRSDRRASCIR